MAQRAASYSTAVLHKTPFQMKHCSTKAPQYEASPFHSDMKHFTYAPYDVRKWKMRVYPFAIQRYPHYIMTCNPVPTDRIFYTLLLPTESQAFTANQRPDREQTENGKFSLNRCVLNKVAANSLFGQVAGPFQEIISQPHRE